MATCWKHHLYYFLEKDGKERKGNSEDLEYFLQAKTKDNCCLASQKLKTKYPSLRIKEKKHRYE